MPKSLNDLIKYDPRFLANIYLKEINLKNIKIKYLYDYYFTDQVISTNFTTEPYIVHLQRNNDLFYYAEKIQQSKYFDKIKKLFPKFYRSLLPFYFSWGEKSLLCLNDSWSCLGWIDHFLNQKELYIDQEIILIHFDSHSDMANPLIAKNIETGSYYDLLRNDKIDTNDIIDFFIAVAIGSIGISNYINILSIFFKKVSIFYINQFTGIFKKYNYKLDFLKDNFFQSYCSNLHRMHNIYEFSNEKNKEKYPHMCFETNSIKNCLPLIPKDKNIYLHFDMDYFNNWFGGSPDECRSKNEIRNISQQYEEIDKIVKYLERYNKNICHTSISLSPGFFPSKYWIPSTKYLINSLNKYGIYFSLKKVFPNFDTN